MSRNTETRRLEFLAPRFGLNWGRLILLSAAFLLLLWLLAV